MGFDGDDDEFAHMHATMLPPTASSTSMGAGAVEGDDAARNGSSRDAVMREAAADEIKEAAQPQREQAATREHKSDNPFAPSPSPFPSNDITNPFPRAAPVPVPPASVVLQSATASPSGDDFIRVSEHCNAKKCFRLQWEAEMNPRCRAKTTISLGNDVYIFDGFYLLCHGDPPSVSQFEYTRGGVMCKIQFVLEDLPRSLRVHSSRSNGDAHADPAGDSSGASGSSKEFCHSMFLLQRYLFAQLLRIQPMHLFMKIFLDPSKATGDLSDICSDYHIIPRFIAVNQQPLLNKQDLLAPHRIGFAIGNLLSVENILQHLEASAKFTAIEFLTQFDSHQLVDIVISTRINGTPGAFRVDGLVYKNDETADPSVPDSQRTSATTPIGVISKDGKEVLAIKHSNEGAWNYDGAKSKKKIRKWQELGAFLQLSPKVDPLTTEFKLHECHLTGLRSDIFEVGCAMPMVLKHIRHFNLLSSFEENMGFKFNDKSLLRQAFTHGSYVDVGMQNVNTWEATFSRVHLGHVFENTESLKRTRSMLYERNNNPEMDQEMKKIADKHLSGEFKEEFHSKYLCPYERLEFLGDAVLSFLVASSTFLKLPNANEGFLHQARVDIVNNDNLGKMARTANFESLLLSAFDPANLKPDTMTKIVADCFEALLGALYKDQGIVPCRALLGKLISRHDDELRELFFLSTDEIAEKAAEYVEIDRKAIQKWSKYMETRVLHRRFTVTTKVEIKNTHLWLQAMTHASFKAPQIDEDEFICSDASYERIEFLGDAVLQLLSSAFLVDVFPYYQEHLLTQVRSSLVKNTRLAVVARDAGYEEFIRLGNLVKTSGDLYVEDVLADVFEASLGAVFLENVGDLGKVNAILEKSVFPVVKEAIRRREWMNPKKVFSHHITQWGMASGRLIDCKFKTIKPAVPSVKANDQSHSVGLYINNFLVARATGRTISAAQDAACSKALRLFGMKFT
uniref:RNase III domain-containing protein n=1 Tax=Globisporangium ultimum (strain ATCC 200006 / CBS 805.95 / DAOM BR144) TaxID=431595 RepID=K3WUI1_GLOUD